MKSEFMKTILLYLLVAYIAGLISGLNISRGHKDQQIVSTTREIINSDTTKTTEAVDLKQITARVDTIYIIRKLIKDSSETDTTLIGDIVAKGDTTLEDSSHIAVEYSYAQNKFRILAELKNKIITNTIKETQTITVTETKDRGLLYLQAGFGLVANQEQISPGIYLGIGYSIEIF
ncbi:MAG: hypothetical protein KatS3mg036_0485 [Ignavibacterium sp.]|uniref:hypothetical protein n=1 Tax=Ignavibacterium sp. TaxID=2651167 RepID=UPI0021DDC957|nr:hypothetical protein [Ignavibacterium sp.]BDQ01931.1 MAG: hypothetical protein KatS3mg037_0506 [Ignavibacterium sp.]GIV45667.1 MAG: hypothetical protein KatS3mg036_0485 [Ignavibacterium sp.]